MNLVNLCHVEPVAEDCSGVDAQVAADLGNTIANVVSVEELDAACDACPLALVAEGPAVDNLVPSPNVPIENASLVVGSELILRDLVFLWYLLFLLLRLVRLEI
ncbi:hypothetical protein KFK09_027821 [Dendrobium nobile]|uniref:Uncharacterized protein n=1 Tax=Dendrobium nobile TaxID=94219 RepID=A0A8T3A0T1_DENNO|nr:hypothetical protein KFK09_027821 [Dendrobium nobile]